MGAVEQVRPQFFAWDAEIRFNARAMMRGDLFPEDRGRVFDAQNFGKSARAAHKGDEFFRCHAKGLPHEHNQTQAFCLPRKPMCGQNALRSVHV